MQRAQLLNSRGGIVYNHPTELMAGKRIFVMVVCLIVRAVDCADFRPIFFGGAGSALDDVGQAIFPVT